MDDLGKNKTILGNLHTVPPKKKEIERSKSSLGPGRTSHYSILVGLYQVLSF